jgi:hypothetical protein
MPSSFAAQLRQRSTAGWATRNAGRLILGTAVIEGTNSHVNCGYAGHRRRRRILPHDVLNGLMVVVMDMVDLDKSLLAIPASPDGTVLAPNTTTSNGRQFRKRRRAQKRRLSSSTLSSVA